MDDPYHHRLLVLQVREDNDAEGDPVVSLEWTQQLNPEAVWDNYDFQVTSMVGSPGGGSIIGGYYPSIIGVAHDPLLMRLNEEGDIPPDCLMDPEPPFFEVIHPYSFAAVPDDFTMVIDPAAGSETSGTSAAQEILIRDNCRPCVRYVNGNLPPELEGDGGTWDTALLTIQDGIDAAAEAIFDPTGAVGYCEVWVAQDDYFVYETDSSDTIQLRPGVHVYGGFSGGYPPENYGWEGSREDRDWEGNVTRIIGVNEDDPEERVFHVVTGATNSTLDGFHVVGGRAMGDPGPDRWGGGMLNALQSPNVANCTFYDNRAWWGGAVANAFAAPTFTNCTFKTVENDPDYFHDNTAAAGGAIFNWGWEIFSGDGPIIDECTFESNHAYYAGGAIHNQNSPVQIMRSEFRDNHALIGGAVSIVQSLDGMGAPFVEACTFSDNVASRWWDENNFGTGGALAAFFGQYVTPASYTVVENSLFHENATGAQQGGAIVGITASESPRLVFLNCTIADNPTGGVRSDVEGWPAIVYNSIVWNNGPYEISPDCDDGAMVYYSDVMGDTGCEGFAGNIYTDPVFPLLGGYELEPGSPCIGAANPGAAPLTDITGEYRDLEPDMGAYEYFDGGVGD